MTRRPTHQHEIKPGEIVDWPEDALSPTEVAVRVTYGGSNLHKTYPSPAGPPALRSDKAKCDVYAIRDWPLLQAALRQGVIEGVVGAFRGGFPSRVWVWVNDVLHEARLTGNGAYHGFPLRDQRQYPIPLDRVETAPRVTIPVR